MPISLNDYKNGLEPKDAEILEVLERKPYQAYAISDLLPKSTNPILTVLQVITLQQRLRSLIEKGLVKSKDVAGIAYYVSAKAIF